MSLRSLIVQNKRRALEVGISALCALLILFAVGAPDDSTYVNCYSISSDSLSTLNKNATSIFGVWSQSGTEFSTLKLNNFDTVQPRAARAVFYNTIGRAFAECAVNVAAGESVTKDLHSISGMTRMGSGTVRVDRNFHGLTARLETFSLKSDAPDSTLALHSHELTVPASKTISTVFNNSFAENEQRTLYLSQHEPGVLRLFNVQKLHNGKVLETTSYQLSYGELRRIPINLESGLVTAVMVTPGSVIQEEPSYDSSGTGQDFTGSRATDESGSRASDEMDLSDGPAFRALLLRENKDGAPHASTLVSLSDGITSNGDFFFPLTQVSADNSHLLHVVELFNPLRRSSLGFSLTAYDGDGEEVTTPGAFFCSARFDQDGVYTVGANRSLFCYVSFNNPEIVLIRGRVKSSTALNGSLVGQATHYALTSKNISAPYTSLAHSEINKLSIGRAAHVANFLNFSHLGLYNALQLELDYRFGPLRRRPITLALMPYGSKDFPNLESPLTQTSILKIPTGTIGQEFLTHEQNGYVQLLNSHQPAYAFPEGMLAKDDDPLDLNDDGLVNDQDIALIEAAITGSVSPTDDPAFSELDTDGDGDIDSDDLSHFMSDAGEAEGTITSPLPDSSPVASPSVSPSVSPSPAVKSLVLNFPAQVSIDSLLYLQKSMVELRQPSGEVRYLAPSDINVSVGNTGVLTYNNGTFIPKSQGITQVTISFEDLVKSVDLQITPSANGPFQGYPEVTFESEKVSFPLEPACEHPAEYYTVSGNSNKEKHVVRRPLTVFHDYDDTKTDETWSEPLPIVQATKEHPKLAALSFFDSQIDRTRTTLWLALTYKPIKSIILPDDEEGETEYEWGIGADSWGSHGANEELGELDSSSIFCGFAKINIANPNEPVFAGHYIIPGCGQMPYFEPDEDKPYLSIDFGDENRVFGRHSNYFYVDDENVYAMGAVHELYESKVCPGGVIGQGPVACDTHKFNRVIYTLQNSPEIKWTKKVLDPEWYGPDPNPPYFVYVPFFYSFMQGPSTGGWEILKIHRDTFPYVLLGRDKRENVDPFPPSNATGACGSNISKQTHEYNLGKITEDGIEVLDSFKTFNYTMNPYKAYQCSRALETTCGGCGFMGGAHVEYDHYASFKAPSTLGFPSDLYGFGAIDFDYIEETSSFVLKTYPSYSVDVDVEYETTNTGSTFGNTTSIVAKSVVVDITFEEELPDKSKSARCTLEIGGTAECNGEPFTFLFASPDLFVNHSITRVVPLLTYLSIPIEGEKTHFADSDIGSIYRLAPLRNGQYAAVKKLPSGTLKRALSFYSGGGQQLSSDLRYYPAGKASDHENNTMGRVRIVSADYGFIFSSDMAFSKSSVLTVPPSPVEGYYSRNLNSYLCGLITDRDHTIRVPFSKEKQIDEFNSRYESQDCLSSTGGRYRNDFMTMSIETRHNELTYKSTKEHHLYIKGTCEGELCYANN